MLLSLCVNVVYVSVIICNTAASKCPHYCNVNVAMLPPLYVVIIVSLVYVSVIICNVVNVTTVVV